MVPTDESVAEKTLNHLRAGMACFQQGQLKLAQEQYECALALMPSHPEAIHLLGLVASSNNDHAKAAQLIERSLQLHPKNAVAWNNLGNIYRFQGLWIKALFCYDRAVALKPNYFLALANKGAAAQALNQPALARRCYRAAMADPKLTEGCRCAALQEEMALCDWSSAEEIHTHLPLAIAAGQINVPTFPLLAMLDAPELHLQAAQGFGVANHPSRPTEHRWEPKATTERIKVGYFSADFHDHATAWLMADLFECHDRTRFEWHAFSFGPEQDDAMRRRLVSAFDHFHDIRSLSDQQAADLTRSLGIDLAIDLKGYTKDCRPGIFAHRAAPIQVNYLGYPGSMGMPYIDYILGDHTVIPDGVFDAYSEKVARLPGCYQPNDSRRADSLKSPPRSRYGLPEHSFVFCCFNNNYKITPWHFETWAAILKQVPNSVLWLYVAQTEAIENLRGAAKRVGLEPSRLVFATKEPHDEHLLRYRCADLFLDTFPCNAHTTASDALWMGLPLLTLEGKSFASRVAASLLKACDLPDLITESPETYVNKAVTLAHNPELLHTHRLHLETKRYQLPLFDTASLASDIETAYRTMVQRHRAGLPPAHFDVIAR